MPSTALASSCRDTVELTHSYAIGRYHHQVRSRCPYYCQQVWPVDLDSYSRPVAFPGWVYFCFEGISFIVMFLDLCWWFLFYLQQFLDSTLYFERKGVPLLYEVIPAMDNLTSFLDDVVSNKEHNIAVWGAALNGVKLLNKYYVKTNESVMPRAAISKSTLAFLLWCIGSSFIVSHLGWRPSTLRSKVSLHYGSMRPWSLWESCGRSTTGLQLPNLLSCRL